jgi:hypothetical protein
MVSRGEKGVQKEIFALAFAAREGYKGRVLWSTAQPGWQISGEVVILVAQVYLGIPPAFFQPHF